MGTPPFQHIGIISDSHGSPDLLIKAIRFLKARKCRKIIHLGDICDSFDRGTCDTCIRILKQNDIDAVKGNNDHIIEINLIHQNKSPVSNESLSYLHQLSTDIEIQNAIFTHSLPFFEELGISCITKVLGKVEIKKFFSESRHQILFRGHDHEAGIIWSNAGKINHSVFKSGKAINLKEYLPCIITCGALTDGLCMIWNTEHQQLTSLSFI